MKGGTVESGVKEEIKSRRRTRRRRQEGEVERVRETSQHWKRGLSCCPKFQFCSVTCHSSPRPQFSASL